MDSKPAEFHCWHATSEEEALAKGRSILEKYGKYLRNGPVIDLGCGEGALLLGLMRSGRKDILGVDSSEELLRIARTFGVPMVESDIWEFLRNGPLLPGDYFYLDVMEHVPIERNIELLSLLPAGSRLIIQTPYTESAMGHRY
jgi:2-polyprenyl-3-methyl-5-hydroxy-6-metoxy-1,4-benzoquinol methylase